MDALVLEGRSTRLSFFYYAYPIILKDRLLNLFIFLCCTFHCDNSKMFNNFFYFDKTNKIAIRLNLHFFPLHHRSDLIYHVKRDD